MVNYPSIKLLKRFVLEAYASAYKSVKVYFRYPAWIIGDLLATPLWMLMLIYPILLFLPGEQWRSRETYEFFYWGMVSWSVISVALWSVGNAIKSEQQAGTLEQLFITNADRIILFIGRLASSSISLAIDLVYMSVIVYLLFGVSIKIIDIPLFILSIIFCLLLSLGFGIVYGALVLQIKSPEAISNILQFFFLAFCGVFYPVTKLPEVVRPVSYFIPFTYAIDLLRYTTMGTETIVPLGIELILLSVMSILLIGLGYYAIKRVERISKIKGKLGFY